MRELKMKDDEVIKTIVEIKRARVKMPRNKEWRKEDRLMIKEKKVYVPKDRELRAEIIQLHHNTIINLPRPKII